MRNALLTGTRTSLIDAWWWCCFRQEKAAQHRARSRRRITSRRETRTKQSTHVSKTYASRQSYEASAEMAVAF